VAHRMIQLANHFRSDDSRRHSEWLRQQQWFIKAKHDQERREKVEDKLDDDLAAFAAEVVMATEMRMREFEARLDSYDEATVVALMENSEALEAVRQRLDDFLTRAFVMDDGRRVFLTEDRVQAFDEFGAEVTRDELDFDLVPDGLPTWEEVEPDILLEQQLTVEREEILEYQAKLDEAREASSDGEMTIEEMDEFDAELEALMPKSVKAQIPGMDAAAELTSVRSDFSAHSNPVAEQASLASSVSVMKLGI